MCAQNIICTDFEVESSEKIFEFLIEAVTDYAIFALDLNGHIKTWNNGAQRLKGYSEKEILGKHFSIFYTEEDKKNFLPQHELQAVLEKGKSINEGWRIRKDGSRFWANVIINPLRDHQGNLIGFSKVTQDLTHKKIAEEQLQELNSTLEMKVKDRTKDLRELADRLEFAIKSRDDFITLASHELNTPLTSLKIQAQMRYKSLVKKGLSLFTIERLEKLFTDDLKQINRLSRLVSDMLDMTKLNTGNFLIKPELINLSTIINKVIQKSNLLPKDSSIPLILSLDQTIEAEVDPLRFEQIIINLLSNALKYGEKKPIKIELTKKETTFIFAIQDSGKGIIKADQQRIFLQYERAISANEISGLGLGLFIVKKLVMAHKGNVNLESSPTNGSKFIIEMPLKASTVLNHSVRLSKSPRC